MRKVRGKGKKQIVVEASNDVGSEKEEKLLASKGKRRPQKSLEDEDEEMEKITNGDENGKTSITRNSSKGRVITENGRKRKRSSLVKENSDSIKVEIGLEVNSITKDSVKSVGFRQNGSRRKNKPRRAAEVGVGVECK